ncbi:hypothetical protein GCM10020256_34510 [Streptomyces thermocoprophilus]
MPGQTLAEKVWDAHLVHRAEGEPDILYIDLHLLHEVTSPQAFDGLELRGRKVARPDLTLATEDHNTPPPRTSVCPSPTRRPAPRSRRSERTVRNSASPFIHWVIRVRELSM